MVVGKKKKKSRYYPPLSLLGPRLTPQASGKQQTGPWSSSTLFLFFSSQHFNSYSDFDLDSLISFRFQFRLGAPVLLFFCFFFFLSVDHATATTGCYLSCSAFLVRFSFFLFFSWVSLFSLGRVFSVVVFLLRFHPVPSEYLVII